MIESVRAAFTSHIETIIKVEESLSQTVVDTVDLIVDALAKGNKLLIMGNGGSAADAQHFAAELVGRFLMERRPLPAIALTTDSSALTAIGNDYGFDAVFSRQVEALASAGDVVFGISTSGNSPNVLAALEQGRQAGCVTISLLGRDGGGIKNLSDIALIVPSNHTPNIQESHITIIHILCDLVEKKLFAKG